jgi:cytochrome c5
MAQLFLKRFKSSPSKRFCLYLLCASLTLVTLTAAQLSREEAINERLKPIGENHLTAGSVVIQTTGPILLGKDAGLKRYKASCYICHDTGASGAPKLKDTATWAPRIAEGKEVLYQHAISGYKAMPPKGTCTSCSDDEIKRTVDYMIEQSH